MTAVAEELWYESHTTLVEVASHALEIGELKHPGEAIDFFESPWNWPEWHQSWKDYEDAERYGVDVDLIVSTCRERTEGWHMIRVCALPRNHDGEHVYIQNETAESVWDGVKALRGI